MRQVANTERKIIEAAQYLVDTWLRSNKRGPFARVVKDAECSWTHLLDSDGSRFAFRSVANAIRLGQGHARFNPSLLPRIARAPVRTGQTDHDQTRLDHRSAAGTSDIPL